MLCVDFMGTDTPKRYFYLYRPNYGGRKFGNNVFITNDNWILNLKQSFKERINMLDDEDYIFIKKSAEKDLVVIRRQIMQTMDNISRYAAQLTELKDAEMQLEKICSKIRVCDERGETEDSH
jgi:hypothetical protein